MPLFNDGPINQDQDLATYENGILTLAAQEQIDLGGKIKLAQQDIGRQLLTLLLKQETRSPFTNWIDPQDTLRRQIGMGDVVVTDPLQQWHAMRTLSMVYRDAYNNQLNDRYQKKWQEYQQLEQGAKELLYVIGVGLVGYPLPAPGSLSLTFQPGTGPGGSFWAQVTWLNQLNQESAAGPAATIAITPGTELTVTAPAAPQFATGWNVYAGTLPTVTARQNAAPNALGTVWTMAAGGLVTGNAPGPGQVPDYYVMDTHVLPRG